MSDDAKPERIDPRTPQEIATAQRTLLNILAIATAFPTIWVTVLAWDISQNMGQITPGDKLFALYAATWGLLSPFIWLGCNGYTLSQIKRGNMGAGQKLPLVPALWVLFWFATILTR